MSDTTLVATWYDQNASLEHNRLAENRLEYSITVRAILTAISQFPANTPLRIADIGGGTGRYAVELAKLGHKVALSDISSSELEIARQYANEKNVMLENIIQADASNLRSTLPALKEEEYDIVLLLGPLYHLLNEDERLRTLQACASMPKKDGIIIVAFVTKFAHLRDLAQRDPKRLFNEKDFYAEYLRTGKYTRNPSTVSHHSHPFETRQLFEKVEYPRLEVQGMIGCEGFLGGGLWKGLNGLNEGEYEAWVDIVLGQCRG